jgi:UDP-2,3-diacylglucosamine pyrophosphatase LpxH
MQSFDSIAFATINQAAGHYAVLDTLRGLVRDGHQVHYLEGNHDFKLGEFFTDTLGIKVYWNFRSIRQRWRKFGKIYSKRNRSFA